MHFANISILYATIPSSHMSVYTQIYNIININIDINTPITSMTSQPWQCAGSGVGRSRLSSLQVTNLLMTSAHEGLRLPVRSFSLSPSLFFRLYWFNGFNGQLRYQYAAAAALIPETPHRFRGASWHFAQMHRKSRIEVLSLSECGHNTKSICLEWKWLILPLIWDIGYIYYIIYIYIYIYMTLKSIIKPHVVFNVFHMTSLMFHHCFHHSSWGFRAEWRGQRSTAGCRAPHIVVVPDRSRSSEVITLTYLEDHPI